MPIRGSWGEVRVNDLDPDIAAVAAQLGLKRLRYTTFVQVPRRSGRRADAGATPPRPPPPMPEAPRSPDVAASCEVAAAPRSMPDMRPPILPAPVAASRTVPSPFPLISEALAAARTAAVPALPPAARPFAGLASAIAARRAAGS